jgi:hypothetical protein
VTVVLLLAAGFQKEQSELGAGDALRRWLGDAKNLRDVIQASGLNLPAGAEALWVQRPQVVRGLKPGGGGGGDARAAAVRRIVIGLSVPLAVCLAALVVIASCVVVRRRRLGRRQAQEQGQAKEAAADGDGSGSDGASTPGPRVSLASSCRQTCGVRRHGCGVVAGRRRVSLA